MQELKRIRNERGWSQRRLAKEAGIDQVTVNHVETGKRSPNVETLEKLARALDIEMADFFPKAQASLFDADEQRRTSDKYLPWLEFAERYADRWREKVERAGLDRGAFYEWKETMGDLGKVMSRLWREEERGASPEQMRNRGMGNEHDNLVMWKAVSETLGLLEVVLPAAQKLFEESEFTEFKQTREGVEEEWRKVADG